MHWWLLEITTWLLVVNAVGYATLGAYMLYAAKLMADLGGIQFRADGGTPISKLTFRKEKNERSPGVLGPGLL